MRAAISDVATGPFDGYIKFPIAVGPFQTQQDKFMTEDSKSKTAAMQGGGFYNRNSTLQAANLTSALPLLEDAARSIAVDGDRPLVIVDYGCPRAVIRWRPCVRRLKRCGCVPGKTGLSRWCILTFRRMISLPSLRHWTMIAAAIFPASQTCVLLPSAVPISIPFCRLAASSSDGDPTRSIG